MAVICYRWGDANVLWSQANWYWSQCSGSVVPPTPVTESIVQQPGIDAQTLIQPWLIEPWNPYRAADREQEKKRKLVRLICRIRGETFEEEKAVGNRKLSVDDVKMVITNIADINLDVKKLEE